MAKRSVNFNRGKGASLKPGDFEATLAWVKRGIGMCPWCGQALHPGRRCENDDIRSTDSGRKE
jgi:hypothetical protein